MAANRDGAPGGGLAMALEAARLAAALGAAAPAPNLQMPSPLEQALYSQLLASGQLGDSLQALAAAAAVGRQHNPLAGGAPAVGHLGGGGSYAQHTEPRHHDLGGGMGGGRAAAGGRTRSSDSRSSSAYASRHQAAEQRRRTRINER